MHILLPIKRFSDAKTRLAPAVPPQVRADLARAMAEHVLALAAGIGGPTQVLVLAGDAEVTALAARAGVPVDREDEGAGQSAAIARAARRLASEGIRQILALSADLPLLTETDIRVLIAAHHETGPSVTVAADRHLLGSNALALSPPDLLLPQFGTDSLRRHREAAREKGVEAAVLYREGLAFDIDTPEDLRAVLRRGENPASRCLARKGMDAPSLGV